MTRKFKPWNKTWLVYFVLSIWAMWNDAIFFLNKKHLWYLEQTSKNTTFWIFEFDDKQYYSNSCESWIPDTLDTNCIMPKENMFMDLKKMKIFVRKVHKRCKNTYSCFLGYLLEMSTSMVKYDYVFHWWNSMARAIFAMNNTAEPLES